MIYVIFQITFLSSRKGKQKEVNFLPFFLFPFSFLPSSLPPSFPFLFGLYVIGNKQTNKKPRTLSLCLWSICNSVIYPVDGAHFPCCFCSAAKSCPTLCNPMDCSTPDFSILHYLLETAQVHSLILV